MKDAVDTMSPDCGRLDAERAQAGKETSSSSSSSLAVLVVDSCASSRRHLANLLRECNYQVHTAQNRKAGLQFLCTPEGARIGVVLKEHDPPQSDACRFIRTLARTETQVPVIVVSSHDDPAEVMKCVSGGALDYLVKPLRHNELRLVWTRVWMWQKGKRGFSNGDAPSEKADLNEDSRDKSTVQTSGTAEAPSSDKQAEWTNKKGSSEQDFRGITGGTGTDPSKEDASGLYTRDHFGGSRGPSGPSADPSYEANNEETADGGNSKPQVIRPFLAKSGSDENTSESAATQQACQSNGGLARPLAGIPRPAPDPAPKSNAGHAFRPYDQHAASYKRSFSRLGAGVGCKSSEAADEEGILIPVLLTTRPSTGCRSQGDGPEELTSGHSPKWVSSPSDPFRPSGDDSMPPAKSPKRVSTTALKPKVEPAKVEPSKPEASIPSAVTPAAGPPHPQDSVDTSFSQQDTSRGCANGAPSNGMQQLLAAVTLQQNMAASQRGSMGLVQQPSLPSPTAVSQQQAAQLNPLWIMNHNLVAGQQLQAFGMGPMGQMGQLNPLQAAFALQQQQQQQQQQQVQHVQQQRQQQMLATIVQAQQQQAALAAHQILLQQQLQDMNCGPWGVAAAAAGWPQQPGGPAALPSQQQGMLDSSVSGLSEMAGISGSQPHHPGVGHTSSRSVIGRSEKKRLLRAEALARWREKKKKVTYSHTVRYENRKICANTRPRVNGRFARGALPTTSED